MWLSKMRHRLQNGIINPVLHIQCEETQQIVKSSSTQYYYHNKLLQTISILSNKSVLGNRRQLVS